MLQNRWAILTVMFVARASMGFQFQSIGSVSTTIVERLAIDFALLGTLIGMYKLAGVAFAYPAGLLGQRYGDKVVAVAGFGLMVAGGLLTAAAPGYDLAIIGRTVSGIGATLFNVLAAKMVIDWFIDKELTFAMAVLVNSWPFGIAVGLAIQPPIAESYDVGTVLYLSAVLCAVGLVLVLVFYQSPGGEVAGANRSASAGRLGKREFILVSLSAMVWLLFNGCLILVVSFTPAFLTTRGLSLTEAGLLTSVGTWLGIATIPLGGFLVQKGLDANHFMVGCLVISGIITVLIPALDEWLIVFILFGLIAWAPAGPIVALPARVLRKDNRSLGLGIFYSYYYVGIGILMPAAGFLRDFTQLPGAPIVFAGALMFAAVLFLFALRMMERRWRLTT